MRRLAEEISGQSSRKTSINNKLNDLNGKEWLQFSRSWWFQTGLGKEHPDTSIEAKHPAPFSFKDVQKLIRQFTKPGMTVLDPFCGVGSTLKAAALSGRNGIGIDVSTRWCRLAKERIDQEIPNQITAKLSLKVIRGDSAVVLKKMEQNSIDFIVTSPPYWNILTKNPDHKVQEERVEKGLLTRYSSSPNDLGNIEKYSFYLKRLTRIVMLSKRVLKPDSYMVLIVSDFRHGSDFYPLHMHVLDIGIKSGLSLKGILILVQSHKRLFPYGYPFDFVQNFHHQYGLIFKKSK